MGIREPTTDFDRYRLRRVDRIVACIVLFWRALQEALGMRYIVAFYCLGNRWVNDHGHLTFDLNTAHQMVADKKKQMPLYHFCVVEETTDLASLPKPK